MSPQSTLDCSTNSAVQKKTARSVVLEPKLLCLSLLPAFNPCRFNFTSHDFELVADILISWHQALRAIPPESPHPPPAVSHHEAPWGTCPSQCTVTRTTIAVPGYVVLLSLRTALTRLGMSTLWACSSQIVVHSSPVVSRRLHRSSWLPVS